MERQRNYKAGIYCRLSRDDDNFGDSASIQTQRSMLIKYCEDNGYKVADVYIDDGCSGTTFDRPDFKRLVTDIENGDVNMVVTKDLSRLGRDYIQTGYYTEVYFPDKNVRYIAINDGVDTDKENNDIAPFKNILNDMYARDISRKIKSAKRHNMTQGKWISGAWAYGYKQDPNDKNKLAIDEGVPADTVRLIFKMALEGKGVGIITKHLRAENIITPGYYHAKTKGDNRFVDKRRIKGDCSLWIPCTVRRILKSRIYCGDMVQHKNEQLSYKTKKRSVVKPSDYIIVENTHEPIVSREDFELIQKMFESRRSTNRRDYVNIFSGLVKCGHCKCNLNIATRQDGKLFFRCHNYLMFKEECPTFNTIMYQDLYNIVCDRLRKDFRFFAKLDIQSYAENNIAFNSGEELLAEKCLKAETRLAALTKITKKLYEDYSIEKLTEAVFDKLLLGYTTEQQEIEAQLKSLNAEKQNQSDNLQNLQKLKETINKYLNFETLTQEMLVSVLDHIEVYPPKKAPGYQVARGKGRTQLVQLHFRYIGNLPVQY